MDETLEVDKHTMTADTDIVERLRKPNGITDFAAMIEAANLIERLRAVPAPSMPEKPSNRAVSVMLEAHIAYKTDSYHWAKVYLALRDHLIQEGGK